MRLRSILPVGAMGLLAACASPPNPPTALAQADCVSRETSTGSNMVKRVGCVRQDPEAGEQTRERLNSLPSRTAPEPGAR